VRYARVYPDQRNPAATGGERMKYKFGNLVIRLLFELEIKMHEWYMKDSGSFRHSFAKHYYRERCQNADSGSS